MSKNKRIKVPPTEIPIIGKKPMPPQGQLPSVAEIMGIIENVIIAIEDLKTKVEIIEKTKPSEINVYVRDFRGDIEERLKKLERPGRCEDK